MELADVADSKSVGSNTVGVQVPSPAPCRDGDFDTMGIKISVPTFCSKHSKAITFRTFRKKAPSQIGLRSDQRWCLLKLWGYFAL